jgi:hypothetical protein
MRDKNATRQVVIEFFRQCRKVKKITESQNCLKIQLADFRFGFLDETLGDTFEIDDSDLESIWPEGVPKDATLDEIEEAIKGISTRVSFYVWNAGSICHEERLIREKDAQKLVEAERRGKLRLYTLADPEMDRIATCKDPLGVMRQREIPNRRNALQRFYKESYGQLQTASELHYLALTHNFDDVELLPLMTHNPKMDRGTALALFWNRNLLELLDKPREEVSEWAVEAYDITIDLLERLISGFYTTEIFRCVPDPYWVGNKDIAVKISAKLKKSNKGEYDGVYHPRDDRDICE